MANVSKAVVSVLGVDRRGIIAKVSHVLFERGSNILDISQTILGGYFNMIMIVDITKLAIPFGDFVTRLPISARSRILRSTPCTKISSTRCTPSEGKDVTHDRYEKYPRDDQHDPRGKS